MSFNCKRVLLCTGASNEIDKSENKFRKCLIEAGHDCDILEALEFEFMNLDLLQNCLKSDSYSGNWNFLPNFFFLLFAEKGH